LHLKTSSHAPLSKSRHLRVGVAASACLALSEGSNLPFPCAPAVPRPEYSPGRLGLSDGVLACLRDGFSALVVVRVAEVSMRVLSGRVARFGVVVLSGRVAEAVRVELGLPASCHDCNLAAKDVWSCTLATGTATIFS